MVKKKNTAIGLIVAAALLAAPVAASADEIGVTDSAPAESENMSLGGANVADSKQAKQTELSANTTSSDASKPNAGAETGKVAASAAGNPGTGSAVQGGSSSVPGSAAGARGLRPSAQSATPNPASGLVSAPSGLFTRGGCLGSAPAQGGFAGWTKSIDASGECTLTIAADASGNNAMPNDANIISGGRVDATVDHIVFQGPNKTKLNNTSAQYFHGYNNDGGFKTFASNGFVDTSAVTDMTSMFSSDFALTSLDVSGFDTSNVTTMNSMFSSTQKLDTIHGLTDFHTQNVTNMSTMFYASKYTHLDVSSFDTSKVTTMHAMFLINPRLTSIVGLDHFRTTALTDLSYTFYGIAVQSLDLSSFDTSKVTTMDHMFTGSGLLNSVKGLEKLNTSSVTNMDQIFTATGFASLDLSGWDTVNVQGQQGVALPSSIQKLTLGVRGTPSAYPGEYKSLQVNGLPEANNGREGNGYTGKWVKVVDEPIASNEVLKSNEYDSSADLVRAINIFPHTPIPAVTYVWERYRDVNTNVTAPGGKYKVDGSNAVLRSHGYSVNVPQGDDTFKLVQRFAPMALPTGPTNLRYANGGHASHDYTFAGWKDAATNTTYAAGDSVIPADPATTVVPQWTLIRDASALNDEIVQDSKLVQADYTPATWSVFKKALDAAKAVLDGSGNQSVVDNALNALRSAQTGLEIVPDKLGLTTLLDMANAKHQADYRPSTWTALADAMANANTVNADVNATRHDVSTAQTALKNAIDALVRKADKSSLSVLISKSAAAHESDYTAASWTPFTQSLSDAKTVMDDVNATQQNVNDAQGKLLDAFTGLDKPAKVVVKPSESGQAGQSGQSSQQGNTSSSNHQAQSNGNGNSNNGKPASAAPASQPVARPAAQPQTTVKRIVIQRPAIAAAPVVGAPSGSQNGSGADSGAAGNDKVKEPKKKDSGKYICKTDTGNYVTLSGWIEPASMSGLPRCSVRQSAPETSSAPKTQFNWWIIVALVFIAATAILAYQYYRSEHSREKVETSSQHAQRY
ncbi:BspA family leucine-rich repeat surface protein [Bifidobacterium sp. ESL0798]|uniref:BspA family leucine-rich repeat surface protein n=1 Tax=Bifidobacterium sp. ESL0798 TaxID=2983235 RepID=UPI0023F74183|nr:BspA family leucine-rich repeat surface protein [Bifidobacterium sp. ESL0798]WEV73841.1 BspA family leucine-rich repeat surface protein [Bifidobacterium sp. ESL0798]